MKHFLLILIFLSFGFGLLIAQDRRSDRIEQNLKQLARKIEQIRVLAERYENQEALKVIQSAREDFDAAISLLNEWKDNRHRIGLLEQARGKYQSSNLKADLASRMLLFKPAANLLNQLERLIQQAESVAQGSDANDLRYYLNKARNYYRHSQKAFSQNQYLRGHEFLKIATYFAEKVISLAQGNRPSGRGPGFEEHKNNIQILLNRVSVLVEDNDILNDLYNNVLQYLRRADNAYSRGNLNRAFSNLQIAERLTHRIIDLSEERNGNSREQKIEQDYQSLSRYLNTLRNEFERENKQSRILDKAEEFHTKARKNIDNGEYQQAESNLKLSQRMAIRAFNKISAGNRQVDSENLQSRINEIQHLLNLQESRLEKQQNKSFRILFNQANDFFKLGRQEYENSNYLRSSYYLNLTLRILNKNEKLFKEKNRQISSEKVLEDLNRVEQLILRLKLNSALSSQSLSKIEVLENLLVKARLAFNNGNYLIAREMVIIVQNQLTHIANS